MPVWCRCGLKIFVIEIEADIAVEIAVIVIARIAFDGAPNLLGRFGIAGQDSDIAVGDQERRIDAKARPRFGEQDGVRIGEEIANAGVLQQFLDAVDVAALRQPDAARPTAEVALELTAADLDLRAAAFRCRSSAAKSRASRRR